MQKVFFYLSILLLFTACGNDTSSTTNEVERVDPLDSITVTKAYHGETSDGPADLYTLTNKNGMEVKISTYGGTITHLKVADRAGNLEDVVLGFDSLSGYFSPANAYFGAIIGRYGNRIGKGKFTLDGTTYTLPTNNGPNTLHGGIKGFDKVLWTALETDRADSKGIEMSYTSADMEEGFPGNLTAKVSYLLNNQNELLIEYEATTDKTTICNLTNHTYFNLAGAGNGDILDHELQIKADWITPVDKDLIPTGKMMAVKGTPFNFRAPKPISQDIDADHEQIQFGKGYDHNFVIGDNDGKRAHIASVFEPTSGRLMNVFSEEPAVQFYTGNFLDGAAIGKRGKPYNYRNGFCLETQHYPDSPNQEKFPSTVLQPGETYRTSTVYAFSTREAQ